MLDGLAKLNAKQYDAFGDPEINTRIAQYEMAFRMQTSVPELVDVASEPQSVRDLYARRLQRWQEEFYGTPEQRRLLLEDREGARL